MGNTSSPTSKNSFPQMHWKWKHKGWNSDPREMFISSPWLLFSISSWINSFNKGQVPILHECGTEKNMSYFQCGNLSLRKCLSNLSSWRRNHYFQRWSTRKAKSKKVILLPSFALVLLLSWFLWSLF